MNFKWLNESKIMKDGDRIVITAPAKTDFFQGNIEECAEGILPESLSNAPFYYTEVEGDFVLRVKVSHAFTDVYDSASVMVICAASLSTDVNTVYQHCLRLSTVILQ